MKKTKKILSIALAFALLLTCAGGINAQASITNPAVIDVDAGEGLKEISKNLFGIFIEDINYADDGGLCSNLIRNNSFEQRLAWDMNWDCRMTGWEVVSGNGALREDSPLNDKNPSYFHADSSAVLVNFGYPDPEMTLGILLKKGETYDFSFYERGSDKVAYAFTDESGKAIVSGEAARSEDRDINGFGRFDVSLKPSSTAYTRLEITVPENCDIDFFSLESTDSFGYGDPMWKYTTLRRDIVEALKDLNPAFVRFPGGCLAEGAYKWQLAYNWKKTIGDPIQRKQEPNIWGYNQSFEVGFYEYFCLCDYLDAEPIPVVHAGLLCQGRDHGETNPLLDIDSEEFAQHIQDIFDLIEYANGDTSTYWGSVRAENGHPEPFDLKYLAVGNENWMEDYFERFDAIYNAIKREHPEITVITSAGAWADGKEYDYAWNLINEKYTDTIVDEHYYVRPWWVYGNYERYDNYSRDGAKVFVGEYAVHREGGEQITKNNLYVSIDEAVHMTSLIRNGDIVELACYAPLLARLGYTQWAPNLIWYNSDELVKTPSYYVQQLFMNNTGTAVAKSTLSGDTEDIHQVVSVDEESKTIYVVAVNNSKDTKRVKVNLDGFGKIDTAGEMRYFGSGLYNTANNFGFLNDFFTPEYKKVTVTGNSVSEIIGPNSLNIICLSYGGENNFLSPGCDAGYKHGSLVKVFFFDILAKIVVWFTATDFYKKILSFIEKQ